METITPALGIDLGTTNSTAVVINGEDVILVTDAFGNAVHASALCFERTGTVTVGNQALLSEEPSTLLFSLKRLLGIHLARSEEKALSEHYPFTVVSGANKEPYVRVDDTDYAIPELCGMILRYLKDTAENLLQIELEMTVITVPAHFTDTQRQMTRLAADLAGLKTLRIINEPTAAALGYGFGRGEHHRLAVYDLGGGTFDVTILDLDGNIIEVLATDGDGRLGGDDFDRRLLEYLREKAGLPSTVYTPSRTELFFARDIKHKLSEETLVEIDLNLIGAPDKRIQLSRSEVEACWSALIDTTIEVCKQALFQASTQSDQIDAVLLVGGATKMPAIQKAVARSFGQPPLRDVDPETVVAVGAATQAYALIASGIRDPEALPLLIDVLPQTLGIASVGGSIERIIEKNSVVPVKARRTFTTTVNHQQRVRIEVYQGESLVSDDNVKLGEVLLENIPPAPKGHISVDVVFEMDVNGCLTVKATDYLSGSHEEVRLYISSGYDEVTLNEMRKRTGLTPLNS